MSDTDDPRPDDAAPAASDGESSADAVPASVVPDAVVRKRRGLPIVWLVPIVAAAVGGWLWWKAVQDRGPSILISFETADGLVSGKTKVKYNDIEIGEVEDVTITSDLAGVEVSATLAPWVEPHLRESARFWVVRPRVGGGGVSGPDTLMSGQYINFEPGPDGAPTRRFTGLELPPVAPADAPGLKITLESDTLGSIDVSSAVYFRQIVAGQVERYRLTDERTIEIDVYIEPEYAALVRTNTLFWNASGVDLSLDATGLRLSVESLNSLVAGGIAFDVLPEQPYGDPAPSGQRYRLYDRRPTLDDLPSEKEPYVVYFPESTRGLTVGSPVEFRGTVLGEVTDISLQYVVNSGVFRTRVEYEVSRGRITIIGGDDTGNPEQELARLIRLGLRARLETGSLLTGARFVSLDLYPASEIELAFVDDPMTQIPTIASTGKTLVETLDQLPQMVEELRAIAKSTSDLLDSPDTRGTLANVRGASKELEELLRELRPLAKDLGPVLEDLGPVVEGFGPLVEGIGARVSETLAEFERTAATARAILTEADGAVTEVARATPEVRTKLLAALDELSASLRAVRVLADTLERHPEALIRGKSGGD